MHITPYASWWWQKLKRQSHARDPIGAVDGKAHSYQQEDVGTTSQTATQIVFALKQGAVPITVECMVQHKEHNEADPQHGMQQQAQTWAIAHEVQKQHQHCNIDTDLQASFKLAFLP